MKVNGVTFDFWSTLFRDIGTTGKERQAWRLAQMTQSLSKAGWLGNCADVEKAVEEASALGAKIRLQGEVDFKPEEQLDFIFTHLQVVPSTEVYREVYEAYTEAAAIFPPDPIPGALETVQKVAKLCPIALISNTGITPGSVLRKVLAGAGILDCFTTMTFSNEVNLVKPNAKIFKLTSENLGVGLENIIHVGDDYEADILGAKKVGARGVWLRSGEKHDTSAAFGVIEELPELLKLFGR